MRFQSLDACWPIPALAEARAGVCPHAFLQGERAVRNADTPEFNTPSRYPGQLQKYRARRSWPGILSREIIQYP
jgi:hypothetical protein